MATRIKMKDEFLKPYQARLKELENKPDSSDPFEELAVIKETWLIAKAWLNDMGDRTKVYEIEE